MRRTMTRAESPMNSHASGGIILCSCSSQETCRIGELGPAFRNHAQRRSMNSLEHSIGIPYICAHCCADATLYLRRLISDYVSVKTGKHDGDEIGQRDSYKV